MPKSGKNSPVVIPKDAFTSPDTRAWCVDGRIFFTVRPTSKDVPCVVMLSEQYCYLHSRDCECKAISQCTHMKRVDCEHLRIARAEHQRLFGIYGEYIPDSETILLDAVKGAYSKTIPTNSEEDVA